MTSSGIRAVCAASALALGIVSALMPPQASAAFRDLGAGARALGMGNAFSAVADDASAVHFNPAGLAALTRPELTAGHSRLFMGLDDGSEISHNFLAYAHPLGRHGTVGAGVLDLRLSGWFSERSYLLSYGRRLTPSITAGGNVKVLERGFTTGSDPHLAADPLFQDNGTSSRGFGLDAGMLYRAADTVTAALMVANLNEPDMGLRDSDPAPRSVRLGLGYRPQDVVFDTDLVWAGGDWDILMGGERWFMRRSAAARLGFGFGSRSDRDVSAGLSLRASRYQIDYAFQIPLSGISGTMGTHRFSLTVRFGKAEERPAPAPRKRAPLERKLDALGEELKRTREANEATRSILERMEKKMGPARRPRPKPKPVPKKKAKPKGKPKSWKVREGDTLRSIAERVFGDPARWIDIYRVNQDRIGAGGKLTKGQTLVIP